ncbi:MAG: adenosylmethionine-8-amino-7-oxononanoate aminotransferase [Pirellulales bacterium]
MGGIAVPGSIDGRVTSVSPVGNLVTDIAVERLREVPRDERTSITCDEHMTVGLFGQDHQEPPMTFLGLLGESGFLELCMVGDHAGMMLGIRPGEKVVVRWT